MVCNKNEIFWGIMTIIKVPYIVAFVLSVLSLFSRYNAISKLIIVFDVVYKRNWWAAPCNIESVAYLLTLGAHAQRRLLTLGAHA